MYLSTSNFDIFALNLGTSCGTTPAVTPKSRIIGGDDATPGSWPWMGSLRAHSGFYNHQCGAVLIAPQWAVTAAHCMELPR